MSKSENPIWNGTDLFRRKLLIAFLAISFSVFLLLISKWIWIPREPFTGVLLAALRFCDPPTAANEDSIISLLTFLAAIFYTYLISMFVERNNEIRRGMSREFEIIDRYALKKLPSHEMGEKTDVPAWYEFLLVYTGLVAEDWSVNPSEYPRLALLENEKSPGGEVGDMWKDLVNIRADVGCRSEAKPFWSIIMLLLALSMAMAVHQACHHAHVMELFLMGFTMFTMMYLFDAAFITGRFGFHDVEAQRMFRQYFIALLGFIPDAEKRREVVDAINTYVNDVRLRRVAIKINDANWLRSGWSNLWSDHDAMQAVMSDEKDKISIDVNTMNITRLLGNEDCSLRSAGERLRKMKIYTSANRLLYPVLIAFVAMTVCFSLYGSLRIFVQVPWLVRAVYNISAISGEIGVQNTLLCIESACSIFLSMGLGVVLLSLFMRQEDYFLEELLKEVDRELLEQQSATNLSQVREGAMLKNRFIVIGTIVFLVLFAFGLLMMFKAPHEGLLAVLYVCSLFFSGLASYRFAYETRPNAGVKYEDALKTYGQFLTLALVAGAVAIFASLFMSVFGMRLM